MREKIGGKIAINSPTNREAKTIEQDFYFAWIKSVKNTSKAREYLPHNHTHPHEPPS